MVRRRRDQLHARGRVAHLGDPGIDLGAGQFAALARLGTLGHLDLQLFGLGQIVARHAEAPRGYLLNSTVFGIAVGLNHVAGRVFAALAGIALAAEAVHGDGQAFVRLLANRAVGHRPALEAAGDLLDRLDLLNGHRLGIALELQQAPQGRQALGLIVDQLGVLLVHRVVVGARRPLQQVDRLGVEEVMLAALAPLIVTAHIEGATIGRDLGESRLVAR